MSLQAGKLPRFSDVSWRWIAYCSSAAVLGGVVFAFVQEVELKRDVPCEIVSPSELKITGHEGLVTRVLVAPGQPVREGQPLFELSRDLTLSSDGTPRPKFDERMRDAKLATIEAQFVDRRSALSARLQAGELSEMARTRELQALDRQRSRARQLVRDTRATLERLQGLADYVTAERLEQARARQHQSEADAAQGDARRLSLQAEIETLRGARHELQAQIAELDAQRVRDIQDVQTRFENERQDIVVAAPRNGTIAFSSLVAGHTLQSEDISLVIDTGSSQSLSVMLRIPSRQRGFVREGQTVKIKLDAYPYARFGAVEARIRSISGTTMGKVEPTSPPALPTPVRQADYMAWALLPSDSFGPARRPLRILPGMQGTASIVVERRSIAEWVLEPLFQMVRG
ncbi:HlyD family efflux transporter periplasmic adaptor subunit [Pseudomonas paraeruginosa]|uniref:HlyD family secretion protein n=1 Tax=Pseudomonas aeruginosa group TaxID=136841 RepID=UPI0009AEC247|nr:MULTISPECIES: HlyD family efflux transporter periplasmic adaptor subunit [Pseudomonas aeruginosa group]KSF78018.2 hemolysin D [Pseudomonas aeruginosa]PTC35821.1 HlyD family secretion protein [Pseudomonas aeruginosa]